MNALLDYLVPRADILGRHPLYRMERRRQRGGRSLATLARYTARRIGLITGLVFGYWCLSLLLHENGPYNYSYDWDVSLDIINWLLVISAGATVLLDFAGIVASITGINRERLTVNWDLVRITRLRERNIIAVKHAVAQIRVWRMTTLALSLRIAVVTLYMTHAVFVDWGNGTMMSEFFHELFLNPVRTLLGLLFVATIFMTFLVEPLWRMRAVTAMGTAVSARAQGATTALLAGFAAVAFMWISQGILGYLLLRAVITTQQDTWMSSSDEIVNLLVLIDVWIVCGAIYFYYRLLRVGGLSLAERYAFRE